MNKCEDSCCAGDICAEDVWLEDQAHKLQNAIPDSLYMELKEIVREARESSPLGVYLTDIALTARLSDVFEGFLTVVMFDVDEIEYDETCFEEPKEG